MHKGAHTEARTHSGTDGQGAVVKSDLGCLTSAPGYTFLLPPQGQFWFQQPVPQFSRPTVLSFFLWGTHDSERSYKILLSSSFQETAPTGQV